MTGVAGALANSDVEPISAILRRELLEVLDQVEHQLRIPEDFHEKMSWKGDRDLYVRLCGAYLRAASKLQRVPGLGLSPLLEPNLAYVLEQFADAASEEHPFVAFPAVGALKEAIRELVGALDRGGSSEPEDEGEVFGLVDAVEGADADLELRSAPTDGAYLAGRSGIELLPSCVGSDSGELYATWTSSLLNELMTEFAPITPSRKLLIEGVVHAHIDAAIHTATWRRLAHDDLAMGRARLVERYGRLADQCRKRVSMNLDALRRPHAGPVKVSIGSANVNFGSQNAAPYKRGEPAFE